MCDRGTIKIEQCKPNKCKVDKGWTGKWLKDSKISYKWIKDWGALNKKREDKTTHTLEELRDIVNISKLQCLTHGGNFTLKK